LKAHEPDAVVSAQQHPVELPSIRSVFQQAGIDPGRLDEKKSLILEHLCSDPAMLTMPWPHG
jgi:hypothetical protein